MMGRLFLIFAIVTTTIFCQEVKPAAFSVSGSVVDATTAKAIEGVRVTLTAVGRPIETDSNGAFTFHDVLSGTYTIRAMDRTGAEVARVVTVASQDLSVLPLRLEPVGQIMGHVLDEAGEPIQGAQVYLIVPEYTRGGLRYIINGMSGTDDRGAYVFARVRPGFGYLILAGKWRTRLEAVSNAPVDPKLRGPVLEPTYFGGADRPEGAQAVILRPGEFREGIDIEIRKTQSRCVDGTLSDGTVPAEGVFSVYESQVSSGYAISTGTGTFVSPPNGRTGLDGRFRVCDLHSGQYEFSAAILAAESDIPSGYFKTTIVVGNRDLSGVTLSAQPMISVSGEVTLVGDLFPEAQKDRPEIAKPQISIKLEPVSRAPWMGELPLLTTKVSVPGTFTLPHLLVDSYIVHVLGLPKGTYLKDLTYSGMSILHAPLNPGSALDNTLRITVSSDGGVLRAVATDHDDKPVPDARVLVVPNPAGSELEVAQGMITGSTDQNGIYVSGALRPGKYLLLATEAPIDNTPGRIALVWSFKSRATEVEVTPGKTLDVRVQLIDIEK